MDLRQVALYASRTRVGMGLFMMAAPKLAFGPVYGVGVRDPGAAAIARMMGARETALGVGAAIAVGERRGSANWISMLACADGVDAVVNLTSRRLGWRGRALGIVASISASQVGRYLREAELQPHRSK